MANKKEMELRKLKKHYLGGSLVAFLVVAVAVFCAFAALLAVFGLYITDSKVRDEYARVENMANLYRLSEGAEGEGLSSILEDADNDYIVLDENGRLLREHGSNTCDLENGGRIDILGDEEDLRTSVTVYPDKTMPVITPGLKGKVGIDNKKLVAVVLQNKVDKPDLSLLGTDLIRLPFWIDVPVGEGVHLAGKSYFSVSYRELAIIALIAVIIIVLTILMLIFIVVYICKTIINRKKMNRVFFMDEVTGNNNWMWFLKHSEEMLKRKKSAQNKIGRASCRERVCRMV